MDYFNNCKFSTGCW